jgi:HSP20 family protein
MPLDPSDAALKNLERLISRDPLLRDIVSPTLPGARRAARFSPDVDVIEDAEGWIVWLEVPGVSRESLHVDVEGTKLTVRGEKRLLRAADAQVRVAERVGGKFAREFLLPFAVAADRISARLHEGVLQVRLPRVGEREKREVPITSPGE